MKQLSAAGDAGFRAGGWLEEVRRVNDVTLSQRKRTYVSPLSIAESYAQLGQKDEAFHWLDIALQERDHAILDIHGDPFLDPIRNDPRFATVVKTIGFPQ